MTNNNNNESINKRKKFSEIKNNCKSIPDKHEDILYLYLNNEETMESIGESKGITRQRVDQILKEYGVEGFDNSDKKEEEKFSRDEMISALQTYYDENKKPPRCSDWDQKPSVNDIIDEFKCWDYALLEAGLPLSRSSYHEHYSDEKLIDEIHRAQSILGHVPSFVEMNDIPKTPRAETYRRRFGSWNEALEAAGIDANSGSTRDYKPKYSNDDLLNAIADFIEENGERPRVKDWKKRDDVPDHRTIRNRFGSWIRSCWLADKRVRN